MDNGFSRQHGVALLLAMALMLGIAGATALAVRTVRVLQIQHVREDDSAFTIAQAVEKNLRARFAVFIKEERTLMSGTTGSLYSALAKTLFTKEGEKNTIFLSGIQTQWSVQDASNCLNINAASEKLLKRYLSLFMLEERRKKIFIDSLLDWIDKDTTSRAYGAESSYYLARDTPYTAANAPLRGMADFFLIRDMQLLQAQPLVALLCAYGGTEPVRLNIHTLKIQQAPILVLVSKNGISLPQARKIIRSLNKQPYERRMEYLLVNLRQAGIKPDKLVEIAKNALREVPTFFTLHIEVGSAPAKSVFHYSYSVRAGKRLVRETRYMEYAL